MAYIVTAPCVDCSDRSCVEICPAACFYVLPVVVPLHGSGILRACTNGVAGEAGILLIHPDECTSCGACETECPVEAIYEDCSIPEELQDWISINSRYTRSLKSEQKVRLRQHPQ